MIDAGADIPDSDRAGLLEAVGRCYLFEQEFRPAWRSLLSAIDLSRGLGDRNGAARATDLALRVPAPPERYVPLMNAVLDAPGELDPRLEAQLLGWRAGDGTKTFRSDEERARDDARLRQLVEELDLTDVRARLVHRDAARGFLAFDESALDESIRLYREAIEMFEEVGELDAGAGARWGTAWFQLCVGRLDDSEPPVRDLIEYARASGLRYHEQNTVGTLAFLQLLRGELDQARETIAEIGTGSFLVETTGALIAEREGKAELEAAVLPLAELGGGVVNFQLQIHGHRARALHLRGEDERARDDVQLWADALARIPDDGTPGPVLLAAVAGASVAALADEDVVRDIYGRMGQAADVRVVWSSGADEFRGDLALRLDLVDEAEAHYRTGMEWAEGEQLPVEAARCRQGLAEVAVRRGNNAEAMEYLDAASKVFEEHNNGLYLDQVIAKKLELQGVGSSDGADGVTIVAPEPGETLPSGGATDGPAEGTD